MTERETEHQPRLLESIRGSYVRLIDWVILVLVVLTCVFTGYVAYQVWRAQQVVEQGVEEVQKWVNELERSFSPPAGVPPVPDAPQPPAGYPKQPADTASPDEWAAWEKATAEWCRQHPGQGLGGWCTE